MTFQATAATARYERLCARADVELDLALQALAISPIAFGITPSSFADAAQIADLSAPWLALSPTPSFPTSTAEQDLPTNTSPTVLSVPPPTANCSPLSEPTTGASSTARPPFRAVAALCRAAFATRENVVPLSASLSKPDATPSAPSDQNGLQEAPARFYQKEHQREHSAQGNRPAASKAATSLRPNQNAAHAANADQEQDDNPAPASGFRSARSALGRSRGSNAGRTRQLGSGMTRDNCNSRDRPTNVPQAAKRVKFSTPAGRGGGAANGTTKGNNEGFDEADLPEVNNVEPRLVQMIMNEVLDRSPDVDWNDIAGLHFAKQCVMEAVVWPMLRPDIFNGLRGPPKGLLLFGPPGTGKTMIGRAIASRSGAKFFNISASSLVSKWAGEGEKTVRALFGVARALQVRLRIYVLFFFLYIIAICPFLRMKLKALAYGNRRDTC